MPAGTFTLFGANKDDYRINDLVSANLRMALVTSVYAPNITATGHALWASVSANEIANGQGYTTGANLYVAAWVDWEQAKEIAGKTKDLGMLRICRLFLGLNLLVVATSAKVTGNILTAEQQTRLAEDTNKQLAAN